MNAIVCAHLLQEADGKLRRVPAGRRIRRRDLALSSRGVPLCRWCTNVEIPRERGPRATHCSIACVEAHCFATGGRNYIRRRVFARDNGVCAECGENTRTIASTALRLRKVDGEKAMYDYLATKNIGKKRKIHGRVRVGKLGGGLWDADHVVAVSSGGGCTGLDNLVTLCISCHKVKTADMRRGSRK